MDLELNGRVAVVTGASKGIGLAVVRTLLDEGARVVAASRSRSTELDALDGELLHVPRVSRTGLGRVKRLSGLPRSN